jgi:hypothetical protein
MQTYADLVELARICVKQAREAKNPIVSAELKHLAKGIGCERHQWIMESFPTSQKSRPFGRYAFPYRCGPGVRDHGTSARHPPPCSWPRRCVRPQPREHREGLGPTPSQ